MQYVQFLRVFSLFVTLPMSSIYYAGTLPTMPTSADPNTNITLDLENVTLREALKLLFRKAGVRYQMSLDMARIADHDLCSVHLHGVTLQAALGSLLGPREGVPEVVYHVKSGICFISTQVTLNVDNRDPLSALKQLFGRINASFIYMTDALGTNSITLSVKDSAPEEVFSIIQREMHARTKSTLTCIDGVYVIKPEKVRYDFDKVMGRTLFVDLKQVPLRAALRSLFFAVNLNYVLYNSTEGDIVVEEGNSFRTVLEDILRYHSSQHSSQPDDRLSYTVTNDIFTILRASDEVDSNAKQ